MAGKRKAASDGANIESGEGSMNTISIPKSRREINGKLEATAATFEIRRAGAVICSGHILNLGYPSEVQKDMARNGMHLYKDGKRVKL